MELLFAMAKSYRHLPDLGQISFAKRISSRSDFTRAKHEFHLCAAQTKSAPSHQGERTRYHLISRPYTARTWGTITSPIRRTLLGGYPFTFAAPERPSSEPAGNLHRPFLLLTQGRGLLLSFIALTRVLYHIFCKLSTVFGKIFARSASPL